MNLLDRLLKRLGLYVPPLPTPEQYRTDSFTDDQREYLAQLRTKNPHPYDHLPSIKPDDPS